MEDQQAMKDSTGLDRVIEGLVHAVEGQLLADGENVHSWASIVVTATLVVAGTNPDVFYVDGDGLDHALTSDFSPALFTAASSFDPTAVSALVHVENTPGRAGGYEVETELGYRSETGVLEYVHAPFGARA